MKTETLKVLIQLEFKNCENMVQFRDRVLDLIDIYESDKSITLTPGAPYIPVKGDKVPYSTICSCNPANGGSGICGCVMPNQLVTPGSVYTSTTDVPLTYNYKPSSNDAE